MHTICSIKFPWEISTAKMEPDRLSELPDEVLHHILSSSPLSPRDPLRLSELSKRWRHLWRSTPFLHLTDGDFLLGECSQGSFTRFVDTLLSLRDTSDLLSFRLSWCMDLHPEGHHHLSAWLRYAVGHNSKVISLHFYEQMMDVVVPECVFTCQRLEELKIVFSKHTKVALPGSVRLSRLRKCHLSHVGIVGPSMDKLVSSCSLLEELTLKQSTLVSANIAFRALRHLDMEDCFVAGEVFRISCPSLLSCHLVRNFLDASKVLLENLSSVVSASVHNPYDAELKFRGSVMNIFGGLTNAETLKIISSRIQVFSSLPSSYLLRFLVARFWMLKHGVLTERTSCAIGKKTTGNDSEDIFAFLWFKMLPFEVLEGVELLTYMNISSH